MARQKKNRSCTLLASNRGRDDVTLVVRHLTRRR
jgi:hypothetical protein